MEYFTIEELTTSATATKYKIDNTIPADKVPNFIWLIEKILDPIREKYGKPIKVNNGYRSPALITAMLKEGYKVSPTTQHAAPGYAAAADITGGNKTENKIIFDIAKQLCDTGLIVYDQLISENDFSWVHIGVKKNGGNRKQILYLK